METVVLWLFLILGSQGWEGVGGAATQEQCEGFRRALIQDVKNVGTRACQPYEVGPHTVVKKERQHA